MGSVFRFSLYFKCVTIITTRKERKDDYGIPRLLVLNLFGVEISLHFGGFYDFCLLLLPAFLFQVSKMLVRRGERWKGNVANLATVFSTIGLQLA